MCISFALPPYEAGSARARGQARTYAARFFRSISFAPPRVSAAVGVAKPRAGPRMSSDLEIYIVVGGAAFFLAAGAELLVIATAIAEAKAEYGMTIEILGILVLPAGGLWRLVCGKQTLTLHFDECR